MKKTFSLLLTLLFIFHFGGFSNIAKSKDNTLYGSIQSYTKKKDLFIKSTDRLDKKHILNMTVSKIIGTDFSKNNEEFFAEITDDVEGKKGIIIPSGTIAHGKIKKLTSSKSFGRDGGIDLSFDYLITPEGRAIPIEGKMSTRLHPITAASKIALADATYTLAGGIAGTFLAINFFGPSAGSLASGASLGGVTGLSMALKRKGRDVLISPGDEIKVKLSSSISLPVYKKNARLQNELHLKGLGVKIKNITYQKNPYGEVSTILLSLSISNKTNTTFSLYDLALVNKKGKAFYPAILSKKNAPFEQLKPNDKITTKIPFAVDNVKQQLWLTFYEQKKALAKISINNAYRQISDKNKKQNKKLLNKRINYYKESNF